MTYRCTTGAGAHGALVVASGKGVFLNDNRSSRSVSRGRVLVPALVAVLLAALLPGVALAGHNPDSVQPCADAPQADFADYEQARDAHEPSIDCALFRQITSGAGQDTDGRPLYRPQRPVDRAQMAQFIVNALVAGGYDAELPEGDGEDQFGDISGSFARVAINRLALAGIVSGTGNGQYTPSALVTRQQMATFIVAAARFAVGQEHPVTRQGSNRFTDVGRDNQHRGNIEAGADAGLFRGTSDTTFAPRAAVLRDQMATFLVSLLNYTYDPSKAPQPNSAEIRVASTTVDAGQQVTGDINGDNVRSATVGGCGLDNVNLSDNDTQAAGIQFSATIPASQPAGECTLTFTITFEDGRTGSATQAITIRARNQASVTLTRNAARAGEAVTGVITGSNIKSVTLSGCGLTNEPVEDRDAANANLQFSEIIPAAQPPGSCALTFTVTYQDNQTQSLAPQQFTVTAPTGVTTQPELVSAQVVSTTTTAQGSASNPAGTVVRYVFDETVTGAAPRPEAFYVYAFDGAEYPADAGSQRVESEGRSVLVRFGGVNTAAAANDLTVAAVDDDAVTDDQDQVNPEGDLAIGAARTDTVRQAGVTVAPDLQSVGPFRPGANEGTTAVDFKFDQAAFVVDSAGFNVVLINGSTIGCTGPASDSTTGPGLAEAGGNGTTTITAICANPASGSSTTPLTATNVARGFVETGAVSDTQQEDNLPTDTTEGTTNPLQAATVAGSTTAPDLMSAEFRPGAGTTADEVVYTFDQVVVVDVDAGNFRVYDTSGSDSGTNRVGTDARRNTENTRQVIVTFTATALDDAVGASVDAAAVTGATETAQPNAADEIGVATQTTRAITPGKTDGPDLTGVAVNPGAGSATYTFDEDVNPARPPSGGAAVPGSFLLYLADGSQLTCTGVPGTSTFVVGNTDTTRNQVTCTQFSRGTSPPVNATTVGNAVLGTVDAGAVDDAEAGTKSNPYGAEPTTGGTGVPAQ